MSEHATTPRRYYVVFGALLGLLALTVGAALLDWGPFNVVVALGIAGMKIALIAVYFMHLERARTTVRLFAAAGAVWLLMMLVFLLSDYLTRVAAG